MEKTDNEFLARMSELLAPDDYRNYLQALGMPPMRFARINPLKRVDTALIAKETGGYPILAEGAKPGLGSLHAAGAYYVQEPAAAAVAGLIVPHLPQNALVLDMCAAPGGKVTAAASNRPDCKFLANEIVFARAKILLSNVERLGLRNCTVTSLRPEEIAARGEGLFDAVIADVPCSGEGMLRKADFGSGDLSDKSVESCATRARKILDSCHACLKAGGILSFSTCTFNLAENEEQVAYMAEQYGYEPIEPDVRPPRSRTGFGLPQAVRFFPQDGGGEGHFCCLLRKPADAVAPGHASRNKFKREERAHKSAMSVSAMIAGITREVYPIEYMLINESGCEYVGENYPFGQFPALRRGVRICDFEGGRAEPHHHFAAAANPDMLISSDNFDMGDARLTEYLRGAEIETTAQSGYRVIRVEGITLGLVKVSDGRAKNRYPKGLRLT